MKLLKQLAIVALVCCGQSVFAMEDESGFAYRVTAPTSSSYDDRDAARKMVEFNKMLAEFQQIKTTVNSDNARDLKNRLIEIRARFRKIRDNGMPEFAAVLPRNVSWYYQKNLGDAITNYIEHLETTYNLE